TSTSTSPVDTQMFVYDKALGNSVYEITGSTVTRNVYAWPSNKLVCKVTVNGSSTTASYFHTDGLGSVSALTDSNGAVTNSYKYDPFGNILSMTGNNNAARYIGTLGAMDDDTGLVLMGARYYDPMLGRFISKDKLQRTNRYMYCSNNPVNFVDPSGLEEVSKESVISGYESEIEMIMRHWTMYEEIGEVETALGMINYLEYSINECWQLVYEQYYPSEQSEEIPGETTETDSGSTQTEGVSSVNEQGTGGNESDPQQQDSNINTTNETDAAGQQATANAQQQSGSTESGNTGSNVTKDQTTTPGTQNQTAKTDANGAVASATNSNGTTKTEQASQNKSLPEIDENKFRNEPGLENPDFDPIWFIAGGVASKITSIPKFLNVPIYPSLIRIDFGKINQAGGAIIKHINIGGKGSGLPFNAHIWSGNWYNPFKWFK
ncbi:MAG: RHS repeat-associated core domain-containing protein, partial [Elusimicrobiota bacterium]